MVEGLGDAGDCSRRRAACIANFNRLQLKLPLQLGLKIRK